MGLSEDQSVFIVHIERNDHSTFVNHEARATDVEACLNPSACKLML